MALLNKLVKIPSLRELEILALMSGDIQLWSSKISAGAQQEEIFLLNDRKYEAIKIKTDYEDVEFKFECLFLCVSLEKVENCFLENKIAVIEREYSIFLVFRAEWLVAASTPSDSSVRDQSSHLRGKFENIKGSSACISAVGLLFLDEENKKKSLIFIDDEFPLKLSYSEDNEFIEMFLSECWVSSLSGYPKLKNDLDNWAK